MLPEPTRSQFRAAVVFQPESAEPSATVSEPRRGEPVVVQHQLPASAPAARLIQIRRMAYVSVGGGGSCVWKTRSRARRLGTIRPVPVDEKPMTPEGLQQLLYARLTEGIARVTMQQRKELPPVVYHYSRSSTVENILRGRCIWATEGNFVNDTTELHHARNLICDFWDRQNKFPASQNLVSWVGSSLRQGRDKPVGLSFIASFSAEPDRLSQWRAYADDGAGVALGFDLSALASASATLATGLSVPEVRPCVYDDHDQVMDLVVLSQIKATSQYIGRGGHGGEHQAFTVLQKALLGTTDILGLVLKNPGFHEESEWRAVAWGNNSPVSPAVKFRDSRFGPAPYVEIPLEPLQLKRLGLGPRTDRVAERSFRIMLDRYGCDAEIYHSAVSYR
jgi:hypothetical protein